MESDNDKNKATITINSILGGIAPSYYLATDDQYVAAVGIDPDSAFDGASSQVKLGGGIIPTAYTDFSGNTIHNSLASWFITSNKQISAELLYTYLANGKFNSYDTAFANETNVGTPTNGGGYGAAYYNNYIYLATTTDISRYGPMDGTPTLANTVWTGATLGTQTALTNTAYPAWPVAGVYPSHAMHVHTDNKLYFCDFATGQGLIHYIKTKKTTDEGDTNDGSLYNALDLPFGYYPTDIESYGTDLVVLASQTRALTFNQGNASLFFWDTISDSFYRKVDIDEPWGSALLNANGNLYVFGGTLNSPSAIGQGYSVLKYLGGYSFERVAHFEEGMPPSAGAVDTSRGRIAWAGQTSYPQNAGVVYALGSKNPKMPQNALHCIATASAGTSGTQVTAMKFLESASGKIVRPIMSWATNSTPAGYGIDRYSAGATQAARWRSKTFNVGHRFRIWKITVPLSAAVAANHTITPIVFVDDESSSTTLTVINNTNYTENERNIVYRQDIEGKHNFNLQFSFTGTSILSISFPITIEIEIYDDGATGD